MNYDFIIGINYIVYLYHSELHSLVLFIVGSGSAGAVIASGLPGRVLVLESGSRGDSSLFNIPLVQPLIQKSSFDWQYETSPQVYACKGFDWNKSFWPAGKIQGGSHRLNNMIYHRGHYTDYSKLLDKEEGDELFHEIELNSKISQGKFQSSISTAFVAAGIELGLDDFSFVNLTHLNGGRYTQVNHWKNAETPPEVCANAHVTRIIFDQHNRRKAIGVEFFKHGKLYEVLGRKIILSAGSIGSPKILLHSGIGPQDHLTDIGIMVRENLPVGKNLQDHVTTGLDLIILNQTVGLGIGDLLNPFKVLDYFWFDGEGSPLSLAGCDAMGFVKINQSNEAHDLSFMLLPVGLVSDGGLHLRKIVNLRDDVWEKHFKPLVGQTTVSILPVLLHPKSKGSVKLQSNNFLHPPIIDPNYLSDEDDIRKLITGIRIIEKLVETPSMQKFGAEINPKHFPGCEKFFFDSNEYWECYIRHITLTMFHPIGTCKLGDYDDDSTVVLKNFQVKNIDGLYVVDASVIPTAPSANPHAIITMLAQKFVRDIVR